MTMNVRDFQVVRRRSNLVDLIIPKELGDVSYEIEGAVNFDAAYSSLVSVPVGRGHLDQSIDRRVLNQLPGHDKVRITFDPDNYSGVLTNGDTAHFWLRLIRTTGGGAQPPSIGTLILTEAERQAQQQITIQGDAPASTTRLPIGLPRRMDNFNIVNHDDTNNLLVSTIEDGSQYNVLPGETWSPFTGATAGIEVSGDGGVVAFSASFTNTFPQ